MNLFLIKFSFLLSIPAILGANLLELKNFSGFSFPMVLGFLIAFVFGLLSIYLFYNRVTFRGLRWFGVYCWVMALVSLFLIIA